MTLPRDLVTEFCTEQPVRAKPSRAWVRSRPGIVLCSGKEFFDFSSFDIFGLWELPLIKRAAVRALDTSGFWPHARRESGGTSLPLERFEQRAATFFGAEAATALDSRNQAVLTVITALVGDGDIAFVDRCSDLPVADACAVSGARAVPVDLLDLKQLRIETERHKWARRRILVGESVNGVTGVSQALSEVELICNELRIGVVWDDSFALGGYGMRGVPESSDCVWSPSRLLRLAALNRFAAGLGCLVAGPKVLMDTLAVRSHFIQSEIPLPSFVASVGTSILDALELKVGDRERIRLLWTRVGAAVQSLGWVVLGEAPGPLLSFRVESRRLAEEIREALLSKFVLVDALPAPDSDASGGIVRIILAAHHDERAVGALLNSLVEVRPRLEV